MTAITNIIKIGEQNYHQDKYGNLEPASNIKLKDKRTAGAPPKVTHNPFNKVIALAIKLKMDWVDDYIIGACFVSGGVSNGKPNVSMDDVKKLLHCETICSANVGASLLTLEVSKRRQQLVAQVARFALSGITMFLERNPTLLEAMQNLVIECRGSIGDSYETPLEWGFPN